MYTESHGLLRLWEEFVGNMTVVNRQITLEILAA